jgi:hypothetical protein
MTVLEEEEAHVRYFRASFELGKATEQHLDELDVALQSEEDGYPLFEFLQERSRRWLDDRVVDLASLSYADHISSIQAHVRADSTSAPPARAAACEKIAASLTIRTPDELNRLLQLENAQGRELAAQAITQFGGLDAREHWSSTSTVATLEYVCFEEVTRLSFERRNDHPVITVHIGNHRDAASHPSKGALRTYFCILFYFFHEYVSHAFSIWQAKAFVDGYLLWAERQMFSRIEGRFLRHAFVADTFGSPVSVELKRVKVAAEWIHHVTPGDSFVRFLLTWATQVPTPTVANELDALRYLTALRPSTSQVEELRAIFEEDDHPRARARLVSLGAQVGNHPPNYKVLD